MRIAAFDLSSTRVGWACGPPSCVGITSGSFEVPKISEAAKFVYIATKCANIYEELICDTVVFEELNCMRGGNTTRVLAGVRGAFIAAMYLKTDMDPLPLQAAAARKAAGVNMSRSGPRPKGYMKERVKNRLLELGIKTNNDDEGDAVILLLAADKLLETEAMDAEKP